jgi:hypothetical protein
MDRITGATVDIGSGRRGFRDRNLLLSQAGTIPGATWFNGAQEEIIRIIELLGLTPSDANREQLYQALRRLVGANVRTISAGGVTLTADDAGLVMVNAGGSFGITLPAANAAGGHPIRLTFVRTDTSVGVTTLGRAGGDTVEGATSWPLRAGDRLTLLSDGASTWRTVGDDADRLIGVQIFTAAGTATYTPTPGTSKVIVEVVGGGGGAGGAPATTGGNVSVGGGGSGGAHGVSRITSGFAGTTVTVGAGGLGGTGTFGASGGTSSFGAFVSAPGGPGGTVAGPTAPPWSTGTLGTGNSTGGNLWNSSGHQGQVSVAVTAAQGGGGTGGASRFGAGGAGAGATGAGGDASAPGAGGGGTMNPASAVAIKGGNGAPGAVLIWEYS